MSGARPSTRTENSLRNLNAALLAYLVSTALSFVGRTVFVRLLSTEYLGLNGLFSNILGMLSLTELGVGGAIAYALYAPLRSGDTALVASIMRLYRRLYRIIGCVVLVLGASLAPFLPALIRDLPSDMPQLPLYYLLYVANAGLSYFLSYKRTLIVCDQRQYVSTLATTASGILASLLQITVLLVSHSYLAYLLVGMAVTVAENVVVSALADRMYPCLRERDVRPLPEQEARQIRRNVYAMLCHKVGTVVVYSTDNLIISGFVGLSAVGLYSNYTLMLSKAANLLQRFFSSVVASVGMLALEDDRRHVERVLYRMLFLDFWMYALCSIAFLCLAQPFVRLWVGQDYLLPLPVVLLAATNFYLTGMRQTVLTFRDATGVFWHDRYKPLAEAAANLVLCIPLAMRFGIGGVLLGSIGSTLLVPFWFEGHVLFTRLFEKGVGPYLLRQLLYAALALAAGAATFFLCGLVPDDPGIPSFLARLGVCAVVPNLTILLACARTEELAFCRTLCRDLWERRAARRRTG